MTLERGTPVRFTAQLGAVDRGTVLGAIRFVGAVQPGQQGLYQEPILIGKEPWHIIQFGAWDVPAAEGQFEAIT